MPRWKPDYDLIILGGGSAGIVSGVMAGGLKLRVLLIEKEKMGGECLNTGCVPSKALLHAAKTAHMLRTAADIGLKSCTLEREDAADVMAWVRGTIDRVRLADASEALLRQQCVEIRYGNAHFEDPHTLVLDGQRLRASNFILATGSRPAVPDIPGLQDADFHTNQTIFALDAIPPTLLVVGGGPMGVEMAQAFQRLGSQVTLMEQNDRLLPRDDAELTRELETCLRQEGMNIRLNASLRSIRREGEERIATLVQGMETAEVRCNAILLAVGRAPNIEGLNLAAAGVRVAKERIPTDAALRTSAPHIYACGDLLGECQFSHMAEYEAKTVVRNIVFPGAQRASFRVAPWTTFTDPELAHVGLTEEEARRQGLSYDVLRQPFSQDDRALAEHEGKGWVKVLTQGMGGKILGVHILGPRAGELIQEWVFAMQHGHGVRAVADLIHVYPTLTMASQHAAQRWYEQKAQEPLVAKALETYAHNIRPRQGAIALGLLGAGLVGATAAAFGWKRRRK
jgi:pyruvate/2-oxoglutarate dehydrogenase complex dihydrolipoamide dehydrogenase (E3) component